MSVEQEIGQAVNTAIRDSVFLARESNEDVFQLHARAAIAALQPFIGELERLRTDIAALDADNLKLAHQLGQTAAELQQLRTKADRDHDELRDKRNDLLNIRGILSPNGHEPATPLALVPDAAPAVQWLVDELARVSDALAARTGEAVDAVQVVETLRAEVQRVNTELERARPVVLAAQAWRRWFPSADSMFTPEKALIAAVDALHVTPDPEGWPEELLNARVRFWLCPQHRQGPVEWYGDVAHCEEPGCGRTSDDTLSTPDIRDQLQPDGTYEPAAEPPPGPALCPVCEQQPIGHEGECEP